MKTTTVAVLAVAVALAWWWHSSEPTGSEADPASRPAPVTTTAPQPAPVESVAHRGVQTQSEGDSSVHGTSLTVRVTFESDGTPAVDLGIYLASLTLEQASNGSPARGYSDGENSAWCIYTPNADFGAAEVIEGYLPILVLGVLAVVFATINVVGGYLVTDRMLGMFRLGKGDGGD